MIVKEVGDCWWTYIVECADGTYYTGSTHDVHHRLKQHNSGKGAKYTQTHGPVKLVYSEQYPDRSTAMKRELQIKKLRRQQKQKLVKDSYSHHTLPSRNS